MAAQLLKRATQVEPRPEVARVQLQRLPVAGDRLLLAARVVEGVAVRGRHHRRQRVQLGRALDLAEGGLEPAECGEEVPVPLVRHGVARLQRDRPAVGAVGAVPRPVVVLERERQRGVPFGEVGIQLERAGRRGVGERERLARRLPAERPEQVVAVGEARPGRRVERVGVDRLLHQGGSLGEPFRRALVPEEAAHQIGLVRGGPHRRGPRQAHALARGQPRAQLLGDGARDLAVEVQDVPERAVHGARPQAPVGGGGDQLGGDAHALARAQHRALHDRVDAELAGDLGQGPADALVGHGRRVRDDAQRADPGEAGDQGLGHAVGEEVLVGLAREIAQRQHRERGDVVRRRGGGRRRGRRDRLRPVPGAQVGGDLGGGGVARLAILGQRLEDDALEVDGQLGPQPPRRGRRGAEDLVHQGGGERLTPRQSPGRQLVEHHPQGEEIGPCVQLLAEQLLGGHVGERAREPVAGVEHGRGAGVDARLSELGEAEIQHLHPALDRHHDVGGLEIAVQDALLVRRRQRLGDLDAECGHVAHRQRAGREAGGQRLARHQLHDQEVGAGVAVEVVDGGDARVVEPRERQRLLAEPPAPRLVGERPLGQHLDRHLAAEPLVLRAVDDPHGPRAQLLQDAVVGERGADHRTPGAASGPASRRPTMRQTTANRHSARPVPHPPAVKPACR